MKVLHLEYDQYPSDSVQKLKHLAEVEAFDCKDQLDLYDKLSRSHCDVIFTRLGVMLDKHAMELAGELKYIVTSTTGLNHIDLKAASERNIHVVSLKGEAEFLATVKSTAEHAWGLLLSLMRNLPGAIDHVRQGGWERTPFLSDELDGKTLGVIGFGRLGKIVANYGRAFGMRVIVHDQNTSTVGEVGGNSYAAPVMLNDLLRQSDVVVLLISWAEENTNFMNMEKFSQMKPSSYFINVARGELVDEAALLDVLSRKKIKGAALDVLHHDSAWPGKVEGSAALLSYSMDHANCIITPHMGGYGKDSIAKTRTFVTDKFLSLIKIHNDSTDTNC